MLARLASLRLWLPAAMVGAALIGLAASYFAIGHLQNANERSKDRTKALQTAQAIAAQAAAGAGIERFRALQAVFPNDQLVVIRRGRPVFAGPALKSRDLESTAAARFPGGQVIVRDHTSLERNGTLALTLVVAAVLLFVILPAAAVAAIITRAIRRPIERTIATADRLAGGDLSARMGSSGPEEFVRLGRAFDGMVTRLESADRDQRQFLADVAHEIAHPVGTISGFALAFADGTLDTPAEQAEAGALIASETRRLKGLLADLRELTTLDLAEAVRVEPVEVSALCRELAARFQPAARAAAIDLHLDAETLTITSDRRLLETILGNLLTNAIRYTPAGGQVTLTGRRQRRGLVFAVRDTGVGIAPEHQARIFDRLYRVDATRARATGGTGLGLAIVQRAAQTLHARLELDSEPGTGSEFRLILPHSKK
jgi:signal transduction histidine kinase